ncbi:MAG: DUF378 domain-containing protein [Clostridia bacterium]|nr:DUF378 domain-containing protein [Clostridia bacterium]
MKFTTIIAFSLVIIGAIIWGLIGIFNINLVTMIFGTGDAAVVSRIIYSLVGVSALWLLLVWAIYHPFKVID